MGRRARIAAAGVIGLGLMAFVLRGAQLDRVLAAVGAARLDLIALAGLAMVVTYAARSIRWCYLLEPIGRVSFGAALRATVMGFAATAMLPGRVGELLRPYVLARRAQFSVSAAIGTVVVERVLDLVVILAIYGVSVALFDPAAADRGLLAAMRIGAAAAAGVAVGVLGLVAAAAASPTGVGRRVARITARLPARVSAGLARASHRFSEGLVVMRRVRPLLWATVWTVVVWTTIAAGIWLVSRAFAIDMSPAGAGIVLLLIAVGVAVPTPAGVGGYHAAYQVGATMLSAAAADAAVGAGLVAHAISFLPVTVVGAALLAHDGWRMTTIDRVVGTAAGAAAGADAER